MEVDQDFHIVLKSNSPLAYSGSIPGNFRIKLNNFIDLSKGMWKVALTSFRYRRGLVLSTDSNRGVLPNNTNSITKIEVYHINTYKSNTSVYEINQDVNFLFNRINEYEEIKKLEGDYRKSHPQTSDQIRTTLTCIEIQPNYYASPGDIAADIVTQFKKARNPVLSINMPLNYIYDKYTKSLRISGAEAIVFDDSSHLIKAMGLEKGEEIVRRKRGINESAKRMFRGDLNGRNGSIPVTYDNLYVLSTMVEFSRFNSDLIQLLTSVPVRVIDDDRIEYNPINPEFKRVKDNILNDIDIQLLSSDLKTLNLVNGEVELTLHFKKYLSI